MAKEKSAIKKFANKQKAKGLQKLRWYCQMCEKQCRDENGFKCHTMSESHQRQLLLVAENPEKFAEKFSRDFENTFMRLLKRRYNTRRVQANIVYQEYIADKEHLHMNSTKWNTLTEFVKHLGKEGLCLVDETPKGWFIQWIEEKDPQELALMQKLARREAAEKTEEERQVRAIQLQMERDRQRAEEKGEDEEVSATALQREEGKKIVLALNPTNSSSTTAGPVLSSSSVDSKGPESREQSSKRDFATLSSSSATSTMDIARTAFGFDPMKASRKKNGSDSTGSASGKRPMSALERLMLDNEEQKKAKLMLEKQKQQEREDRLAHERKEKKLMKRQDGGSNGGSTTAAGDDAPWLMKDIVVKIRNKKLADGKYHKCKGYVKSLADEFTVNVRLLDSKTTIRLDQAYLETVIPSIAGRVMILRGKHAGLLGRLERLHKSEFCASVQVREGSSKGKIIKLNYEDFSKYLPKEDR